MWKVVTFCAVIASASAVPQYYVAGPEVAELAQVGSEFKGLAEKAIKASFNLIPSADRVIEAINAAPVAVPAPVGVDAAYYGNYVPQVAAYAPAKYYNQYYQAPVAATPTQYLNNQYYQMPAYYTSQFYQDTPVVTVPGVKPVVVPEIVVPQVETKPLTPEDREKLVEFMKVSTGIVEAGKFEKEEVKGLVGFLETLLE